MTQQTTEATEETLQEMIDRLTKEEIARSETIRQIAGVDQKTWAALTIANMTKALESEGAKTTGLPSMWFVSTERGAKLTAIENLIAYHKAQL